MTYKQAQRISSATPPPSGRKPKLNIAPRQINGLLTQLETYHEIYSPLFQRQEQRYWALKVNPILQKFLYEVRNWRGWHHHMTMTILSHHFLVRTRVEMGDDAPALTVSQARQLLHVVLPKRRFDAKAGREEIQRTQQQNYAAYRSHRKRRQKEKQAKPT